MKVLFNTLYFSSFLLSKLKTISEYIWPPSSISKPFTITPYFSYITEINSLSGDSFPKLTSHLSHTLVSSLSCTLIFCTYPGYPSWTIGTAKLTKAFLKDSIGQPLMYLSNYMVCRAAMQLVVVERAGVMRPALSLTPIHSISYKA